MGDDKIDAMLYAIANLGETSEAEMIINLKTITKKRFIKLLMAKGYQRNHAIKLHEKYMEKYKLRSRIGLEFFIATREEDN